MKLYIKSMVSLRCRMIVETELTKLRIRINSVDPGVVDTLEEINDLNRKQLKENLRSVGLDLITDKKSILIEKIKNTIIQAIHYSDELIKINFSEYISKKLNYDYTYLANVFSEVKGISIQRFIILNKIEKVKELLLYNELTLSEISNKLHYSSASHLSNQFKKVTGLAPSFFKRLKKKRSQNLEDL
jgi:AraC-like DNA-binding protein